jgi:hypothetical protein
VMMTHTLHVAFLPSLDPASTCPSSKLHPSHPAYTSTPSTPHPGHTPPSGTFSTSHPALSRAAKWPIQRLWNSLEPRNILSTLTTIHLKIHTRLVFNEHGKITQHEDTWGLKETIEGVLPIFGSLYELNRLGLGYVASALSSHFFRDSRKVHTDEDATKEFDPFCAPGGDGTGNGVSPFGLGSPMQTRKGSLSGYGGTRYSALGLQDDLPAIFGEPDTVTTDDVSDH